ncbi:hypothetical protein BaRGS_00029830, partial [Batillaria attramentaria]
MTRLVHPSGGVATETSLSTNQPKEIQVGATEVKKHTYPSFGTRTNIDTAEKTNQEQNNNLKWHPKPVLSQTEIFRLNFQVAKTFLLHLCQQEVPMACASPSQLDITDCPVCQSLCLSPTILTCGHLVCRKCLRKTLETKGPNPACPVCGHKLQFPSGQGQTINEMAESFAKDIILEDLVTEKLAGQGHKVCLACPNKAATKICLDCGDMYCAACSNAHRRMTVSKDHVQQDLPQTLLNAPTSSTRPTRTARQMDDIISSSPSEDSIRYSHDTREGPQNMDRKTLKKATRLCEEGASGLKEAITVVDNNMAQLQEVKKRLESQQQLLTAYVTRLARPDDVLMANARVMLPRLERVCEESRQPSQASLAKLTQHVNSLMKTPDKVTP